MKKIYAWAVCLLASILPTTGIGATDKNDCHSPHKQTWVTEDSSHKASVTESGNQLDIVAPGGLTVWYDKPLSGAYTISYKIKVVMEDGPYDRLSDMNCFWGAKDPEHKDDIHARAKWRDGLFENYCTLSLFYVGYGGNENTTTRFRLYNGELYGQGDEAMRPILKEYTDKRHLLKPNHWYKVKITTDGNTTTYTSDGKLLFSHPVTKGQTDGYFAIRLWRNHVKVKDFMVKTND